MTVWIRHGMLDLEIAVLLVDFSDPNFLDCLPQVLSASRLPVCHINLHNSPHVLDWIEIWAVPRPFQHRYLIDSMTRSAILHEDRAALNVHVQFLLFFDQFHVLGSSHSGVRRNDEIHGTPKSFG